VSGHSTKSKNPATDRRFRKWSVGRRKRHSVACTRKLTNAERLDRYVITASGCWEWKGARNSFGYGTVGIRDRILGLHQSWLAHRLSYATFIGAIPPGLNVLHRCDNPPCINPLHLFLGTDADNHADMIRKGRQRNVRGEGVINSKMTDEKVRRIRSLFPVLNDCEIARVFQVSSNLIWGIRHGRSWRHVSA
jgi:HNH endonuclease